MEPFTNSTITRVFHPHEHIPVQSCTPDINILPMLVALRTKQLWMYSNFIFGEVNIKRFLKIVSIIINFKRFSFQKFTTNPTKFFQCNWMVHLTDLKCIIEEERKILKLPFFKIFFPALQLCNLVIFHLPNFPAVFLGSLGPKFTFECFYSIR